MLLYQISMIIVCTHQDYNYTLLLLHTSNCITGNDSMCSVLLYVHSQYTVRFFFLHWVFVAFVQSFNCREWSLCFVEVLGLLVAVAFLVAEHGLCGLSSSTACGLFPDQGLNLCPCTGRQILSYCATRQVLKVSI